MSVLSTTAGLFRIFVFLIDRLRKTLFVSNLRCTHISLYLVLTKQTVNDDLQMQLTHTCDDGLTRLVIRVCTERRIFFSKFCQSFTHLTLTSLGLRLDRQFDNRLWEFHGFQNNRMLLITNSITGCSDLKPYCRSNITGIYFIQLCSLVGMHLQDTSHTLFLVLCRIQHIGTGVDRSGIHTEECQFADKRIGHDLECQCGERLLIGRMSLHLVAVAVHTLDRRDICRRRHELQNSIQKLLNTFIPVCGTTAYRYCRTLTRTTAQRRFQLIYRRLLALQIHHGKVVIQLTDLLYQFIMIEFSVIRHILRDICDRDIFSLIIIINIGFHLKKIDDSLKLVFLTDR